jgi:hypothetical protein
MEVQMRKLILIAAIATMSSSACYANLSLASNESPQESVEQPSLQAIEAKADVKAGVKAEAPVRTAKSPNVSKPKPRHQSGRAFVLRRSYEPYGSYGSYGHCL